MRYKGTRHKIEIGAINRKKIRTMDCELPPVK